MAWKVVETFYNVTFMAWKVMVNDVDVTKHVLHQTQIDEAVSKLNSTSQGHENKWKRCWKIMECEEQKNVRTLFPGITWQIERLE